MLLYKDCICLAVIWWVGVGVGMGGPGAVFGLIRFVLNFSVPAHILHLKLSVRILKALLKRSLFQIPKLGPSSYFN